MILFSGLLQLSLNHGSAAIFQILVALLFVYDAYIYMRPYIALSDEKLIVNNGLTKKEIIPLKDIISLDEKNRRLIVTFKQGSSARQLRILLSHLKERDKELFMKELKAMNGISFEHDEK
jgi:hypothetical protein